MVEQRRALAGYISTMLHGRLEARVEGEFFMLIDRNLLLTICNSSKSRIVGFEVTAKQSQTCKKRRYCYHFGQILRHNAAFNFFC